MNPLILLQTIGKAHLKMPPLPLPSYSYHFPSLKTLKISLIDFVFLYRTFFYSDYLFEYVHVSQYVALNYYVLVSQK